MSRRSFLSVVGNSWVLDNSKLSSFVKERIEAMTKSGYLKYDKTDGRYIYFCIIGGTAEYNMATEMMMERGHGRTSGVQGRSVPNREAWRVFEGKSQRDIGGQKPRGELGGEEEKSPA